MKPSFLNRNNVLHCVVACAIIVAFHTLSVRAAEPLAAQTSANATTDTSSAAAAPQAQQYAFAGQRTTALLVGVGDGFDDATISVKHWFPGSAALLAGISVYSALFDVRTSTAAATVYLSRLNVAGPFVQYEWHLKRAEWQLSPYLGARVTVGIGRTEVDRSLSVQSVSLGGVVGAEYFFTPHLSLNAQSELAFLYGRPSDTFQGVQAAGFLTIKTLLAFAVYF